MKKERIKKKRREKKRIRPCGTITDIRDYFRPMRNIGVFGKPKIERNNSDG